MGYLVSSSPMSGARDTPCVSRISRRGHLLCHPPSHAHRDASGRSVDAAASAAHNNHACRTPSHIIKHAHLITRSSLEAVTSCANSLHGHWQAPVFASCWEGQLRDKRATGSIRRRRTPSRAREGAMAPPHATRP